jgi:hypothetical protein
MSTTSAVTSSISDQFISRVPGRYDKAQRKFSHMIFLRLTDRADRFDRRFRGGNDVAGAFEHNPNIDAVEIDPGIYQLGLTASGTAYEQKPVQVFIDDAGL